MKTIIIYKIIICTLIGLLIIKKANSQPNCSGRTLNIEIFSEGSFENSKKKLLKSIDSTNANINSLCESQLKEGTKKIVIRMNANDNDFNMIDKMLCNIGYINYKLLRSDNNNEDCSLPNLKSTLSSLKIKKTKYEIEIKGMEKNNPYYYKFWHKIIDIDQKIVKTEQLIESIKSEKTKSNQIEIVLQ